MNSVDSGNRSALLSACWQGHMVIADILLTAGAEVNHQCGQGASPLAVAAQEGHMEVLQLLLRHGADPMLQVRPSRVKTDPMLQVKDKVGLKLILCYM